MQESRDGFSIAISLLFRGLLLCVLIVGGGFGTLMLGFSGDAPGTHPTSIYLLLSLLLFLGSGLVILASPNGFLLSSARPAKLLWLLFLLSVVQPFVVFLIALAVRQ